MGKHPQKLREALSNKTCLSQVLTQELKKAPSTSICPTCNPWFQRISLTFSQYGGYTANCIVQKLQKFFSKEGRKIITNFSILVQIVLPDLFFF